MIFDVAALLALVLGRVEMEPLVAAMLAAALVGGIGVGLALLVVRPFLTRTVAWPGRSSPSTYWPS